MTTFQPLRGGGTTKKPTNDQATSNQARAMKLMEPVKHGQGARRQQGTGGQSMGMPVRPSGVAARSGGLRVKTEDCKTEDRRPEASASSLALGMVNFVRIHYFVTVTRGDRRWAIGWVKCDYGETVLVAFGAVLGDNAVETAVLPKTDLKEMRGFLPMIPEYEGDWHLARCMKLSDLGWAQPNVLGKIARELQRRRIASEVEIHRAERARGIRGRWTVGAYLGGNNP